MLENDALSGLDLVVDQLSHVVVIAYEVSGICKGHFLINSPVFGKVVIKLIQYPHSVILDDDFFGIAKRSCIGHPAFGKIFLIFQSHDLHVGRCELDGLVFCVSLFSHDQKSLLTVIESGVFQSFLYEGCLSCIQKSCEKIYGYLFFAHYLLSPDTNQIPKSSFTESSSTPAPITTILPVTSALPYLTSGSPGT